MVQTCAAIAAATRQTHGMGQYVMAHSILVLALGSGLIVQGKTRTPQMSERTWSPARIAPVWTYAT